MKKLIVIRILLLVLAGYLIYSGTRGAIAIGQLVYDKYHVAKNGITTEGEFIEYRDRGYGRRQYTTTRFKFFVAGYKNPQQEAFLKDIFGEDGYEEHQRIIKQAKEILNRDVPNGDWVYGEGFGRYMSGKLSPGNRITVTYLPSNPLRNLAGDHRSSSLMGLFGMEWIPLCLWFAMAVIGVIMGTIILQGLFGILKSSNSKKLSGPRSRA